MTIQNFPAALIPIIQQGYLEKAFQDPLRSKLGYRDVADRMVFPNGDGETITKTRTGLKAAVTTPLAASNNTNLDNGLSSVGWGVEQYTLSINLYAATQDLNTVTSKVGIVPQFLQNAEKNGEQAMRSLDQLAQAALFAPYAGGNTRVTTTLGSAGPTIAVDDIRGFQQVYVNGVATAVSSGNPMTVVIGSNTYSVIGATAAGTNASTFMLGSPGQGISGTLTTATNVTVSDGTAGNAVIASTASSIIRPASAGSFAALTASNTLTMSNILDAVATLRLNAVPEIDGAYNCYLDPMSVRQLFADPDFKQLYQGAAGKGPYKNAVMSDLFGVRFVTTNEAYVQAHPTLAGVKIRRPIVVGADALIEGDFEGMTNDDVAAPGALKHMVDDIVMVTRPPLDRLGQIIAQSWYWIGGFCAPSDTTTNATTVPTASNAAFKRAVMIEHASI